MNIATILAKALLNLEDIGELTQDLPQPERDAIEYAYNQAVSQDWHLCAVSENGLALGALGITHINNNGTLTDVTLIDAIESLGLETKH